jgi:hypothetical protein
MLERSLLVRVLTAREATMGKRVQEKKIKGSPMFFVIPDFKSSKSLF